MGGQNINPPCIKHNEHWITVNDGSSLLEWESHDPPICLTNQTSTNSDWCSDMLSTSRKEKKDNVLAQPLSESQLFISSIKKISLCPLINTYIVPQRKSFSNQWNKIPWVPCTVDWQFYRKNKDHVFIDRGSHGRLEGNVSHSQIDFLQAKNETVFWRDNGLSGPIITYVTNKPRLFGMKNYGGWGVWFGTLYLLLMGFIKEQIPQQKSQSTNGKMGKRPE